MHRMLKGPCHGCCKNASPTATRAVEEVKSAVTDVVTHLKWSVRHASVRRSNNLSRMFAKKGSRIQILDLEGILGVRD